MNESQKDFAKAGKNFKNDYYEKPDIIQIGRATKNASGKLHELICKSPKAFPKLT